MRRTASLLALAVTLAAGFVATTAGLAWSCSQSEPPHVDDLAPGEPIPNLTGSIAVGVYEQEHIAGAPGLVFMSPRTVSVVTRYWGMPPATTGPQRHGEGLGILGASSCGNQAGEVGLIGLGVVDAWHLEQPGLVSRGLPWVDTSPSSDGRLTPDQEVGLAVRFGEPVVLLISPEHRVQATLMAWQYHIAVLVVVVTAAGAVVAWRRQRARLAEVDAA